MYEEEGSSSSSNAEQSSSGTENAENDCMNVDEQRGTTSHRYEPLRVRPKRTASTPARLDIVGKGDWCGTFFIVTDREK